MFAVSSDPHRVPQSRDRRLPRSLVCVERMSARLISWAKTTAATLYKERRFVSAAAVPNRRSLSRPELGRSVAAGPMSRLECPGSKGIYEMTSKNPQPRIS